MARGQMDAEVERVLAEDAAKAARAAEPVAKASEAVN